MFGCSISLFAIGRKAVSEKGIPFLPLLEKYREEDATASRSSPETRIKELERLLDGAEKIISESESVLRYINNEHFRGNLELKAKNEALVEAGRRNEKLKEVIRQYTQHEVWKKASVSVMSGLYKIPDEELHGSLMFMDVKGFTTYAEQHSPSEVIAELNRIFQPATEAIYRWQGDIDKFIGDCIFAKFRDVGAELPKSRIFT